MKSLKRSDLSHFLNGNKKRYDVKKFEEVRQLFQMLDQEVQIKGPLWKEDLDRSDVINIFMKYKGVFGIPELTRMNKRQRNFVMMAWSTRIVRECNRLKKAESGGGSITNEDDNEVNRQGMEDNGINKAGGRGGAGSSSSNNDDAIVNVS